MKMLVSAISANNVIVKDGEIPFINADIAQYIGELTKFGTIVMGYNTWKASGEMKMKNRTTIVLTRSPNKVRKQKGVVALTSPTAIVNYSKKLRNTDNMFVLGGAMTFASMGTYCDEIQLIRSDQEIHGGELTFFEDRMLNNTWKETESFNQHYIWEAYYVA